MQQTDNPSLRIVVPGGSGHIGTFLVPALRAAGHRVTVLSRSGAGPDTLAWDGRSLGPWARALDGADALINLAGRSVDCRYTRANLRAMIDSRVDSTRVLGEAVAAADRPPRVWLQASTATIYAHRFDRPNDESSGEIGGREPGAPAYWRYSIDIAEAWERTLAEAPVPATRRVAMRMAIVMSTVRGGPFRHFHGLCRTGFGGALGNGRQFVSWIHEHDLVRAVRFLLDREDLSGAINLAAPGPLPQRELSRELCELVGAPLALPSARWMLEIGAFFLRSDTELLLKSRYVIPGRLAEAGFRFVFPTWAGAARELVDRLRGETARATA